MKMTPAAGAVESAWIDDFDTRWTPSRWTFYDGREFPGAKGSFERGDRAGFDQTAGGVLRFDFTGGGNYVSASAALDLREDAAAVALRVFKPRGNALKLRAVDRHGETFQRGFFAPDGQWADVVVPFKDWSGRWGGDGNGSFDGPPKSVAILVENSGEVRGALRLDGLRVIPATPGEGHGMRRGP